jgi:hypothetical protein
VPSKSPEQHRLMEAAAHTKGGVDGVPQSVGKEFTEADKRADAIAKLDASLAKAEQRLDAACRMRGDAGQERSLIDHPHWQAGIKWFNDTYGKKSQ